MNSKPVFSLLAVLVLLLSIISNNTIAADNKQRRVCVGTGGGKTVCSQENQEDP